MLRLHSCVEELGMSLKISLKWTVIFLVITLIAPLFGFTGVALFAGLIIGQKIPS